MNEPSWRRLVDLFHEGQRLESILSGWKLEPEMVAEQLVAAHRAGERIDPAWIAPASVRDRLLETVTTREDLTPTEIAGLFPGKIAPPLVRVLRTITTGAGLDTRLYNEETFFERFHDDLAGARSEILVVAAEIKGGHWRRHLDSYQRLIRQEGTVAFFSGRVSELLVEPIRTAGIVLIEKRANANLVLIDGAVLWEGSMNFLLAPRGDEHVRRTASRLQCDEVKDLNDLFV